MCESCICNYPPLHFNWRNDNDCCTDCTIDQRITKLHLLYVMLIILYICASYVYSVNIFILNIQCSGKQEVHTYQLYQGQVHIDAVQIRPHICKYISQLKRSWIDIHVFVIWTTYMFLCNILRCMYADWIPFHSFSSSMIVVTQHICHPVYVFPLAIILIGQLFIYLWFK